MSIGRFLAGIGALIWDPDTNTYLLLRRSVQKDFAAGAWECVTGRVDQGESFEEAVHREVFEELSVEIQLLAILGTTHFYRGEVRPENELLGLVYTAVLKGSADLVLSPEHDEYRWLTAGEARSLLGSQGNRHPSEHWLGRVIDRAEATMTFMPAELIGLHRREGFELDS